MIILFLLHSKKLRIKNFQDHHTITILCNLDQTTLHFVHTPINVNYLTIICHDIVN